MLEIPAESVDEAIEDDVPKQALIELIVAQQAKIIQAATGATGHRLRKRYKEILRFIENVRTEWKSDYFVYNSNRCVHDASFGHSPLAKSSIAMPTDERIHTGGVAGTSSRKFARSLLLRTDAMAGWRWSVPSPACSSTRRICRMAAGISTSKRSISSKC